MYAIPGDLLLAVNSPSDMKQLKEEELIRLADEVRRFIIDVVSHHPGHLGASLGTVELTVALHKVFNAPYDKIVWDVGHQAYAHKILTGRRDSFITNRTHKGISGFPKMTESEYDAFGVGHSSTSISSALGMAVASHLNGEKDRQHIAVIGDGSMTGGMAFEGLNNAGVTKSNILVILNDNGIAIDQSVGALKEYLTDITTSGTYNRLKDEIWNRLGNYPRRMVQKIENAIKLTMFRHSNVFEAFNFRYFGPVDGHDIPRLVKVLSDLKKIPGPKLLHCVTVKGKGFEQAEKDQTVFHAPGLFNKFTGEIISSGNGKSHPPKYQDVFGNTLVELAKENPKIIGITPAMSSGCSLNIMMEKIPERTFDVGIAEQHAVTFAAGLAAQGFIPFCNIYSSFAQRAYDQIIHDVALQKLPVVFCFDRSGLVGEDGPTHHGSFDLAFMRLIPDMIITAPMNEEELRNLMFTAQQYNAGPFSIRYPKGEGVMPEWETPFRRLEIGKGRRIKDGKDLALLSIGHAGNFAVEACRMMEDEGISAAHCDLRFLKPLDEELLHEVFKNHKHIITVEDGAIQGGMGSAVIEFMTDHGYTAAITRLGIPDQFIEQGTQKQLYAECGYDADGITAAAKKLLSRKQKVLKSA